MCDWYLYKNLEKWEFQTYAIFTIFDDIDNYYELIGERDEKEEFKLMAFSTAWRNGMGYWQQHNSATLKFYKKILINSNYHGFPYRL